MVIINSLISSSHYYYCNSSSDSYYQHCFYDFVIVVLTFLLSLHYDLFDMDSSVIRC